MVQLVLGMATLPTPDDAADALAIAVCIANRVGQVGADRRRRPGPRRRRADRARRIAPTSGRSARRSRARSARSGRGALRVLGSRRRDRLGRGPRRRGRVRLARHRGRRDRLPRLRRAGDPRRRPQPGSTLKLHTYHLVREDQQALYGFRTAEELGFFTLLLTVTGVGPEGRARDRRLAPDARPPARDHGPGPGRPRVDPGHRQEARRADHLRAEGEGRRGRDRGVAAAARSRASARPRARSWRRSRRSATRWRRRARRRGSRSPTRRSAARSRTGSRRRCGACSGTEPRSTPQADPALLDPRRVAGERPVADAVGRHDRQHRAGNSPSDER